MVAYTPFFGQMASGIRKGVEEQRAGEAAKGAYMGDPAAMAELMRLDPQQGMAIQNYQQREEQLDLNRQRQSAQDARQVEQDQMAAEDRKRKIYSENREIMDEVTARIGSFDDYETARAYAQEEGDRLAPLLGDDVFEDLSVEAYEQFRALHDVVTGDEWERSGQPQMYDDGQGNITRHQTFINPKTRETKTVPVSSMQAVTGHDPNRRYDIKHAETTSTSVAKRSQAKIDAGLNSAYAVPDIQRAFDLLDEVEKSGDTGGGFEAMITNMRTYFGDPSLEVTNRGELRTLLATDLLGKFESMSGVLSDSDIRLLKSISAGEDTTTPVNRRLLERMLRDTKRNIQRGYNSAVKDGEASDVQEFEEAAASLGMSLTRDDQGGGDAGSSQSNPMTIQKGAGKPPIGTWVKLPSGKVVQVTK